jgi:hypothetical protein
MLIVHLLFEFSVEVDGKLNVDTKCVRRGRLILLMSSV